MAEQQRATSYGTIFKTTFLFGFVQLFKAVVSVVVNKLAAILIGVEGMGLLGVYNNVISLIQTGAGLGLNQSAVRDVAEANGTGILSKRNRTINIILRAVLYTGLFGLVITLMLAYFISDWTLGDHSYTIAYCVLAVVICLNIINDGRQAVLKGLRLMRYLAYASLIGTGAGLLISIPLYYLYGVDGIVPALLLSSILALTVSSYYVRKNKIAHEKISFGELKKEAMPMCRVGVVLMFCTFLQTIVSFCVIAFVRSEGGLSDVGFYSTGRYILSGYFGLVLTALMTDYYPRVAAVNHDNVKLSEELNKQALVTLTLCCPVIVLFVALLPLMIELLYTSEFLPMIDYIKVAIFGTVVMAISNLCDLIFVVKQNTRVLLRLSVLLRLAQLVICYVMYVIWGLLGLGISSVLVNGLYFMMVYSIAYRIYGITLSRLNYTVFAVVIGLLILAVFSMAFAVPVRRWIVAIIIIVALVVSYYLLTKQIRISVRSIADRLRHR